MIGQQHNDSEIRILACKAVSVVAGLKGEVQKLLDVGMVPTLINLIANVRGMRVKLVPNLTTGCRMNAAEGDACV